jgi:hypothetical protein
MRGVGRVGDVDGVDTAALLLRDALENPLGTETFHAHADPGYLASNIRASRSAVVSSSAE